jgi:hypothetical protein
MTQIELPPYRGPRSLLNFVAVEIILGTFLKPLDTHLKLQVLEHRPGCCPASEENMRATPEEHPCA